MAQLITVKLSRFDGSPWGFRLQGGKDFAQPLCIQKVNGGSPAEKAGLQAGDALVKLNDTIDLFTMRHKEAQDAIVRAGNSFEITIQRGGSTWKPTIQPVGNMPKPQMNNNVAPAPVTKTSLISHAPAAAPIGGGYNNAAKPFGAAPQMNGTSGSVKSIVNKQYNTPVGMYSEENIAETLSAQAEVLAGGVLGVNFKKNERRYEPNNSEVLRMVQEVDLEPREQAEPEGTRSPSRPGFVKPLCEDNKHADSLATEYKENLRNLKTTGDVQSYSFRRLQRLLDSGQDPAFATSTGLRRVVAPTSAPTTPVVANATPAPVPASTPSGAPKTQLPPGQNICSECERLIVGVFVRIKERNLHVECFKCNTCGASLKNVGYYNIGTKLYCDVHAKMAARQQPHPPNMEPITIPPGQRPPASAISAALAAAPSIQSPTPVANVSSPSAVSANMAPLPFHQPTPPSSATVAAVPKPFFAPPPPTVSSAAMNKPSGGGFGFPSTLNQPVHSRPGSQVTTLREGVDKKEYPVCIKCEKQIARGPFITALGKTWCPEHFICVNAQCQRQLQDIGFVEEKGDLYCEFCFEKFLAPTCEKCRNKIKGDCLNAIGKHFHPECFVCSYCGKLFGNNPFFLEDGLPYCENDWNELFTTKCFACGFPIEAGDRWVEALNNNYHSQCFNCTMCKKNLEGQSFFAKQGRPFCKTHAR